MTDAGLRELAALSHLQQLDLGYRKVTNAGMTVVAGFQEMRDLNLMGVEATEPGLKDLAGLANLEKLTLSSPAADAGVATPGRTGTASRSWSSRVSVRPRPP